MAQNDPLFLAQQFLDCMRRNAEASEIASLFSDDVEWEIAGDNGSLPWIGKKNGKAAVIDFVNDSRTLIERITFKVEDILTGDKRAVILGTLASRLKRNGKIIKTDFAIVLTIAEDKIIHFQMFEDSFAVSKVARAKG